VSCIRLHCWLIFPFHVIREPPTTLHVPAYGTGFDPAADMGFRTFYDAIPEALGAFVVRQIRIVFDYDFGLVSTLKHSII